MTDVVEPTEGEFFAGKEALAAYDFKDPYNVRERPYVWEFIYSTGAVRYVRSKSSNKAPSGVAGRVGNISGLGIVVRSHVVPNEKLNKIKAPPKEGLPEVFIEPVPVDTSEFEKWERNFEIEVANAGNGHKEIAAEELKLYDKDKDCGDDDIADEELVSHIIACQACMKSARYVLDKTDRALERFFGLVADADDKDTDQAEELALIAKLHKKKFGEFDKVIAAALDAFDCIIENLEG